MNIVYCPRCGTGCNEDTIQNNACPVCGFKFQAKGDGISSIFLGMDKEPTHRLNVEMSVNNMKPDEFTSIFMLLRIAEALEKIVKLMEERR